MTGTFDPVAAAAEFEQRLGEPLLVFAIDQADLMIPQGLLPCCRVIHQHHCRYHVALTLIGCDFDIRLEDGTLEERHPAKQTFEGDVVARPREFAAAVQSVTVLANATAEARGGKLARLEFTIWTLNLELALRWHQLLEAREGALQATLEASDKHSAEWIEMLPVAVLDPACAHDVAAVMGQPDFRHVRAYAKKVIVLPNEIGHDSEYRYVTDLVSGDPDSIPLAVQAIERDPVRDPALGDDDWLRS